MANEQVKVSVPPVAAQADALDWVAIIAFIEQLIQLFAKLTPPPPSTPGGAGPEGRIDHVCRCRETLLMQLGAAKSTAQHMQDSQNRPAKPQPPKGP